MIKYFFILTLCRCASNLPQTMALNIPILSRLRTCCRRPWIFSECGGCNIRSACCNVRTTNPSKNRSLSITVHYPISVFQITFFLSEYCLSTSPINNSFVIDSYIYGSVDAWATLFSKFFQTLSALSINLSFLHFKKLWKLVFNLQTKVILPQGARVFPVFHSAYLYVHSSVSFSFFFCLIFRFCWQFNMLLTVEISPFR